jgi:recombinational DNA repair protein (RecF pathway)
MSHAIYQTSAIILKTKNMRESNKLLVLYTEKFGLVYCVTQSVRELKSKMRYHTNRYSLVTVDLVQGRDIWRMTGIHENVSSLGFAGTLWYELLSNFTQLINRLCSGEESSHEIWQNIEYLYKNHHDINESNHVYYEIIFTIRLLQNLGYWDGKEDFLQGFDYRQDCFDSIENNKIHLIGRINQRIHDTQL